MDIPGKGTGETWTKGRFLCFPDVLFPSLTTALCLLSEGSLQDGK